MKTRWLLIGLLLGTAAAACDNDDEPGTGLDGGGGSAGGTADAGETVGAGGNATGSGGAAGSSGAGGSGAKADSGSKGEASDAGGDRSDAEQTVEQRGEYLVKHVAACGDCHTPRKTDGSLDMTKWLAGVPNFADIAPGDNTKGAIHSKNLTPHATGLGTWSATQIKQAILEGVSKDGSALFPVMPYYVFHNMSGADADAIVAYLQSIRSVDNAIPPRQDLGFAYPIPAEPVPTAYIPDTMLAQSDPNYASATRGKYLAGHIGVCMECHTDVSMGPIPIDVTKLFLGRRAFVSAELGILPGFPAMIYSRNLTPHANGIGGWTAEMVRTALKQGTDKDMVPLCPPMSGGPMAAFGGMTDEDALDIGNYLVSLAPRDNGVIPNCVPPAPPPGDGGASEGGGNDGSTSDAAATSDTGGQ